jgi:hypothetical protein
VNDKRNQVKKDAAGRDDIMSLLADAGEFPGYDNVAFVKKAGEVIARAASERNPPVKPRRNQS